jgi:hypothetical protein
MRLLLFLTSTGLVAGLAPKPSNPLSYTFAGELPVWQMHNRSTTIPPLGSAVRRILRLHYSSPAESCSFTTGRYVLPSALSSPETQPASDEPVSSRTEERRPPCCLSSTSSSPPRLGRVSCLHPLTDPTVTDFSNCPPLLPPRTRSKLRSGISIAIAASKGRILAHERLTVNASPSGNSRASRLCSLLSTVGLSTMPARLYVGITTLTSGIPLAPEPLCNAGGYEIASESVGLA